MRTVKPRKRSRFLRSLVGLGLLALVCAVLFWPDPLLPLPPSLPHTQSETNDGFKALEHWRDGHDSRDCLLLAQVQTLNDEPSWLYRTIHRLLPSSRHWLPTPPGKIRILETLSGPKLSGMLFVPKSSAHSPQNNIATFDADIDWDAYEPARHGEYWLLAVNPNDPEPTCGLPLSGPNDPTLTALRLDFAWEKRLWEKRTDVLHAIEDARRVLMDVTASQLNRSAALDALRHMHGQSRRERDVQDLDAEYDRYAQHQSIQHNRLAMIVTETLAQPDLPTPLRVRLIANCWPDTGQPLIPGSNDTQQVQYLLRTVQRSRNFDAVYHAYRQLDCLLQQKRPTPAVNYVPEITTVLTQRQAADRSGQPLAGYDSFPRFISAILTIKNTPLPQYADAPIQAVPAIGTDKRSQDLMIAAESPRRDAALPNPPAPIRSTEEQLQLLTFGFWYYDIAQGGSMVLARVVKVSSPSPSVPKEPSEQVQPIETLIGPPPPERMKLDNTGETDNASRLPSLGTYLLMTFNPRTQLHNTYTRVSGPRAPLVTYHRLICDLLKLPRYPDRLTQAKAIILNPHETELRRYTALIALDYISKVPTLRPESHTRVLDSAQAQAARLTNLELLTELDLPYALQCYIFDQSANTADGVITINGVITRNTVTDHQIAFLMHVVRRSRIQWKVESAAFTLAKADGGYDQTLSKAIVYPEIEQCLRDRENADLGRTAPPNVVRGYLPNGQLTSGASPGTPLLPSGATRMLEYKYDHLKSVDPIYRLDRKLPVPPNDDLMRKLYAAAEK